jgi:hypothetical protein
MADKLVGGFFAKARNATRQRYVASARTVGRLMRLFHGTIVSGALTPFFNLIPGSVHLAEAHGGFGLSLCLTEVMTVTPRARL